MVETTDPSLLVTVATAFQVVEFASWGTFFVKFIVNVFFSPFGPISCVTYFCVFAFSWLVDNVAEIFNGLLRSILLGKSALSTLHSPFSFKEAVTFVLLPLASVMVRLTISPRFGSKISPFAVTLPFKFIFLFLMLI